MKEIQEYEKDLASIRDIMERSGKVLSLSGLSGVLAGIYALAGGAAAYFTTDLSEDQNPYVYQATVSNLIVIAAVVLVASLFTGFLLSHRKAKKLGLSSFWNPASKRLILNLSIPLLTGGLFILIMLYSGHVELTAPACLIFYGLALLQGSTNTFDEVRYLGYSEIILGLVCALFPLYGLFFWVIGFGVLHVIYGGIMYNKYDK